MPVMESPGRSPSTLTTTDSIVSLNTSDSITDCTGVCPTVYPCLLIHVSLNASDGESWTVALYSDDMHQLAVHDESYGGDQQVHSSYSSSFSQQLKMTQIL